VAPPLPPSAERVAGEPAPENEPQEAAATPALSLAARRRAAVKPLATRQDAVKGVPPLALGALQGSKRLQCSPLGAGKVPPLVGLGNEAVSPAPSLGDLSTCRSWPDDEPRSPSLVSEASMDEWGFDVCGELGSGAMAIVHKVRRRHDGREFAAKRVHSLEAEQLKGLEEEYKLLGSLCHSSIVRAEAFFRGHNCAWLCMELCDSGSIGDFVARCGAFDEPRALDLSLQLLEGVDHLHCMRVVHRDIKPANLLLLPGAAQLKIADFGSACRVGRGDAQRGAMLSDRGTQLYSAPELRFGRQWNERVDIWASGLSAFFMLSGKLPFDSASRAAARALHAGRLPRVAWGAVGPASRSLVLQCLTVEMCDWPTAMELVLHPAFMGQRRRPDTAEDTAPPVAGTRAGGAPAADTLLPTCGLLAVPQGRGTPPGPAAARVSSERALRQLVRNRCLRTSEGPLAGRPAAHSSPL